MEYKTKNNKFIIKTNIIKNTSSKIDTLEVFLGMKFK